MIELGENSCIMEEGDYFVVHWQTVHRDHSSLPPQTKSFVFEKDKNEFVGDLLMDDDVTDIEVGVFNKIK